MVGPGEVDAELQDEVKEECSSKYGPVNKCVIYELPPGSRPEEAVRIFVEFKYPEQAQKGMDRIYSFPVYI
jgi:splicing factor 45